MYSSIITGAVHGIDSYLMRVETDISNGLPSFNMVGFMSGEMREAGERVRVALKNLGIHMPPQRITVNLSPAGIPKRGMVVDLPVSVGLLVCLGLIPNGAVDNVLVAGELGLNGEIRPVNGILSIVMEAKENGISTCIVPNGNLKEGALVHGIRVVGVRTLAELVNYLKKTLEERDRFLPPAEVDAEQLLGQTSDKGYPDLSQVHGQIQAKKVLEIAAAGFHNVLMSGPPGAGKSMLARCLPGIMPPLSKEEALEITKIYSVAGLLPEDTALITERPFLSPHHSVTRAVLIGGGNIPAPGLITLAHLGVLFLDEISEYKANELNSLREPLENQEIIIRRLTGAYRYPARPLLVAAANPCPCGYYPDMNRCTCTPKEVLKYQKRISGPFIDRIDFRVHVGRVGSNELQGSGHSESSETVRIRVMEAIERQKRRFRGTPFHYNSDMTPDAVEHFCPLNSLLTEKMRIVYDQLGMSVRSYHKCLKMARTIADLNGREMILERDLMMAVGFRLPEYNEEEKTSGREFSSDKKIVPANRRNNPKEGL